MIDKEIKKILCNHKEKTNITFDINTKNIDKLKEKGLLPNPTYDIPNHTYFYFN